MTTSADPSSSRSTADVNRPLERIAVGVDGYSEGRDAAVLGAEIASGTGAELMLVAVHPDPMIALPREVGWPGLRAQAEELLRETRAELAPDARIAVETDWSVPRALERVVAREHRQLLVVGSSRRGPEGHVCIGKRTRQLLGHASCALAVAPRGYGEHTGRRLRRIGVGFDGGAESHAALAMAAGIAVAAGAELIIRGVVDERLPAVGWTADGRWIMDVMWDELLAPVVDSMRSDADATVRALVGDRPARVEAIRGVPGSALVELSADVDLLVIGSRRWGVLARVLLGSVGERLMREAACPVLVVPRVAAG
jgi:nucleotide-binding universal stress UspA family protein